MSGGDKDSATLGTRLVGLLEVFDRSGATVTRLPVTGWPVTVGRALSADLVLDDGHVAAEHLRMDAPQADRIVVTVLNTINGVRHGKVLHPGGAQFAWTGEEELALGRLRMRLRLPDMPIAAEQALPQSPWLSIGVTTALVLATLAAIVLQTWLQATDTAKFAQSAIPLVGGLMAGLLVWAGIWALATKLFTGHPQFWRHVRIACTFSLIEPLVSASGYLLAFVFSWESLARFNFLLSTPVLAVGVFVHLAVISPQRRRALFATVATVTALGLAATMGSNWLQNKRTTNQLYLSALFPPSWRIAPTVAVDQFVVDAGSIRARLQERLDDPDDAGADDALDENEDEGN